MELVKIASIAMEKCADAMARAYQRGDINFGTYNDALNFNEKVRALPPRSSGNMGMLGKAPFAGGAEGTVTLGVMRGHGLGVRKQFTEPKFRSEKERYYNKLRTRTVKARFEHMQGMPELYPKMHRYVPGKDPRYGAIDMEYIVGPTLEYSPAHSRRVALEKIDRRMNRYGYEKQHGNLKTTYYNKHRDLVIGDLHGENIKIDVGKMEPKIIDPMVYRGTDPNFPKHVDIYGVKAKVPSMDYGMPGDNPNFGAVKGDGLPRYPKNPAPMLPALINEQKGIPTSKLDVLQNVKNRLGGGGIKVVRYVRNMIR